MTDKTDKSDKRETGSWWTSVPGVLSGAAALVTALTALIIGLHQVGVLRTEAKANHAGKANVPAAARVSPPHSADVVAANNDVASPAAAPTPTPTRAAAGELLAALRTANVTNSVGDRQLLDWLDDSDRHYLRLAQELLRLIGDKRLAGQGADLDKVNAEYVRRMGWKEDDIMPPEHAVDSRKLAAALVDAYNNKSGKTATTLTQIVQPRPSPAR